MGCVSTAVRCYTCFSLQCSSRENHGSEVCAPDLALIQRPAGRRGHRTEREPGAPDRRREVTASPNQATPRCELYNNNNNTELETLQVLRSGARLAHRQKECAIKEGRSSLLLHAAAARCCACCRLCCCFRRPAHCWRMTATIARAIVRVLHVHVSSS